MSKYFRLPFASGGTKNTIPDTQPVNGAINYTTGYSSVYEGDPATDPNALRVERDKLNELQYQITDTLKLYYETAIPPFITSAMNGGSAFSYSKDALVRLSGVVYSSKVNSNTSTPPGANWTVVDMEVFNNKAPTASPTFTGTPVAPTAASTTTSTQLATTAFVRNAMALFGLGAASATRATDANAIVNSGMYWCTDTDANYPSARYYNLLHIPAVNSNEMSQIAIDIANGEIWTRSRSISDGFLSWKKIWGSHNSAVITSSGSNALGTYRVYSDGSAEITRNITHGGSSGTAYAYPVSISSFAGAVASVIPTYSGTTAPGPYGISIGASSFGITGPSGPLQVRIFFPFASG